MIFGSKKNVEPVILDVDTGIDDSVAISIAVACSRLNVLLVTTSSGNVGVEQATDNTLKVLHLFKKDEIPVAKGVELNLNKNAVKAHGVDGLGNCNKLFPQQTQQPLADLAHVAMANAIKSSDKKVTIVALGPLTNIAKLLTDFPEVKTNIERIVIMAGSIEQYKEGELPYFGFNVKIDPASCETVINSGVKIVVSPCDMGHIAKLDWQDVYRTKLTNMAGKIFEKLFREYKDHHVKDGIAMHDSCAVAYLIDPSIFTTEYLHVFMEYYDGVGVLRCKWEEPKNIEVCTKVDVKRLKKLYFKSLKRTRTILD